MSTLELTRSSPKASVGALHPSIPEGSRGPAIEPEWLQQWQMFRGVPPEGWLFEDWIYPNSMEVFTGADVLEAGCGGGDLMALVRPYARRLVGVDMSADPVARARFAGDPSVEVRTGDIVTYDTDERFDVVYCVGVLHHTAAPDAAFANLARLVKRGGRMIVWVYSYEGNALLRWLVEPFRKVLCRRVSRAGVARIADGLTTLMYPLVHTVYRLPLPFLPYHAYLQNFRKLSFRRNACNVFDKLNAPRTELIRRGRIQCWFENAGFTKVHVSGYRDVSWRGSGTKPG